MGNVFERFGMFRVRQRREMPRWGRVSGLQSHRTRYIQHVLLNDVLLFVVYLIVHIVSKLALSMIIEIGSVIVTSFSDDYTFVFFQFVYKLLYTSDSAYLMIM